MRPPEQFWDVRPGLPGLHDVLRIAATLIGYPLTVCGWFLFLLVTPLASLMGLTPGDAVFFRFCGCLIVPGWLLLRFASGLFPFGRRMFR